MLVPEGKAELFSPLAMPKLLCWKYILQCNIFPPPGQSCARRMVEHSVLGGKGFALCVEYSGYVKLLHGC